MKLFCFTFRIDGACRHVLATLFEIMDYISDQSKDSVTSGPCLWVRRNVKSSVPILITDLDTSITATTGTSRPLEDAYLPIPDNQSLPDPDLLFARIKEIHPGACVLDAWEVRAPTSPITMAIDVALPPQKIESFWQAHVLHRCSDVCYTDFLQYLQYSSDEIVKIEEGTQGQHLNSNWKKGRTGILTSSNFKTICHSTDQSRTATTMVSGSSLNETYLPDPIIYGRKNEKKARDIFIRSHRYRHRKCQVSEVGLIVSHEDPILGTSPDGIVKCSICGTFLIEIKCLYTHRNFFPRPALTAAKICETDENGLLRIIRTHKYNYQIQGQMAITGIHKCILIGYTNRGVEPVTINFDEAMWRSMHQKLCSFYKDYYLPTYLRNKRIVFDV